MTASIHISYVLLLPAKSRILTNNFFRLDDQQLNGVFKNYPDFNVSGNFDDAAGTTLLAASVYRLATTWGVSTHIADAERSRAALLGSNLKCVIRPLESMSQKLTDASSITNVGSTYEHFTSDWWLTPVVLPYDFKQEGKHSPESQAFVLEMEVARREWVQANKRGTTRKARMLRSHLDVDL